MITGDDVHEVDWVRPPTSACLVIDRSGSMTGAALATAALSAAAVCLRLPDRHAVISFAGEVTHHVSFDDPGSPRRRSSGCSPSGAMAPPTCGPALTLLSLWLGRAGGSTSDDPAVGLSGDRCRWGRVGGSGSTRARDSRASADHDAATGTRSARSTPDCSPGRAARCRVCPRGGVQSQVTSGSGTQPMVLSAGGSV